MPDVTHLLWTDLETLGTNENRDSIVEWASILTDMDLEVIETYESVIEPADPFWPRQPNQFVRDMHEGNGLFDAIRRGEGQPLPVVERIIIKLLQHHGVQHHAVMLAGSGVGHFDLRFVQKQTPELAKCLAYPVIDVGVMRRFIRDVAHAPALVPDDGDANTKTHRAMDDIRQHLSEAKHYAAIIHEMAELFDPTIWEGK